MARIGYISVLLLAFAAFAQIRTSAVEGIVRDSEGASLGGARVLVHWDSSGSTVGLSTNVGIRHDTETKTDKNGEFRIEVPPGFYDVFVTADAFSPHAQKVRVTGNSGLRIYPKLKADPLVTKEVGN